MIKIMNTKAREFIDFWVESSVHAVAANHCRHPLTRRGDQASACASARSGDIKQRAWASRDNGSEGVPCAPVRFNFHVMYFYASSSRPRGRERSEACDHDVLPLLSLYLQPVGGPVAGRVMSRAGHDPFGSFARLPRRTSYRWLYDDR